MSRLHQCQLNGSGPRTRCLLHRKGRVRFEPSLQLATWSSHQQEQPGIRRGEGANSERSGMSTRKAGLSPSRNQSRETTRSPDPSPMKEACLQFDEDRTLCLDCGNLSPEPLGSWTSGFKELPFFVWTEGFFPFTAWFLDKLRASSSQKWRALGRSLSAKCATGYSCTSNNLKTALFRRGGGI